MIHLIMIGTVTDIAPLLDWKCSKLIYSPVSPEALSLLYWASPDSTLLDFSYFLATTPNTLPIFPRTSLINYLHANYHLGVTSKEFCLGQEHDRCKKYARHWNKTMMAGEDL